MERLVRNLYAVIRHSKTSSLAERFMENIAGATALSPDAKILKENQSGAISNAIRNKLPERSVIVIVGAVFSAVFFIILRKRLRKRKKK